MFWPRLMNRWENIRGSLWFVPTVFMVVAFFLSLLLPEVDKQLSKEFAAETGWLFSGDASAARSILSVLAGALVTVISLVFSLTIVVLQQASNQFTPRVIVNFMGYKGNQVVLGAFSSTFFYSLLILRQIRGEENLNGEFVPAVSVTFAILLATVCICLLMYFIHHTAASLQASSVTKRVHADLERSVERLYPETLGIGIEDVDNNLKHFKQRQEVKRSAVATANHSGFLRSVDIEGIAESVGTEAWVAILPQIGWYITRGIPLVEVGGVSELTEQQIERLRGAFVLDAERSLHQDALFGVRQLVDIALKALSPGINDPTTAEYALSHLGDVMAELADRPFPSSVRVMDIPDGHGQLEVWVNRPSWDEFVDVAFSQIRRESQNDFHVTRHIIDVIGAVANCVQNPRRIRPLAIQINEILDALDRSPFTSAEREDIRGSAAAIGVSSAELAGDRARP